MDESSKQGLEQTKVEDILTTIKIKKWIWTGQVMRLTNNR